MSDISQIYMNLGYDLKINRISMKLLIIEISNQSHSVFTVNKSNCNILQLHIICVLIVDISNMRLLSLHCPIVLLRKLFISPTTLKDLFDLALDASITNSCQIAR